MYKLEGYQAGVNLGHWISQYPKSVSKPEQQFHFENYIVESDFKRVKAWGCDHVRLPVDYMMIENDDNPGDYLEDGLKYVDFTLNCCKKYGLNLVLDLHHAPGFSFGFKYDAEKNNLFTNEAQQQRFMGIWKMFANRYICEGSNIIFELLNEIVLRESEPWNRLWQRTAAEIRKISPERMIMVGSNSWNSANELKNLYVSPDENIIYNFHCYSPFPFTHQRAGWEEKMRTYLNPVGYPFSAAEHKEWFDRLKDDYNFVEIAKYERIDKNYLYDVLRPAKEFIEKNNRPLYCGEYGVIRYADIPSTIRWYDDIISVFSEYGIGHAVWSYRGFANITDENNKAVNEDIIRLIAKH